MKTIGIMANCRKAEAKAVLKHLAHQAHVLRLSLLVCDATASLLPAAKKVAPRVMARRADAIIALGGDGTMLQAAHVLDYADTPILGVNLGNLGFLTSVTVEQFEQGLEAMVQGRFTLSNRTIVECVVRRGRRTMGSFRALNDVVVGWGQSARIIGFEVRVDGALMTSYRGDGLIISTPTGTTGHSLSAGGPILHPETPALLINVICPHALTARPMVVPDSATLEVTVTETAKPLLLSVDGQEEFQVHKDDVLAVRRSARTVRFVHLPGYNYFSVLSQKLHWRGSSV